MKPIRIIIAPDAIKEIKGAAGWYNQRSKGLGVVLKKQINTQINLLKLYPESNAIRYANVRCIVIKKFPYLIHYIYNRDEAYVEIFAVTSTKQKTRW